MAGDAVSGQHLTDSKERVVEVGKTSRDQAILVLAGGADPVLTVRDERGRAILYVEGDLLVALTKALLEAQGVILPVDEAIAGIREQLATRHALGDLIDALHDELQVEVANNSHVLAHVTSAAGVLGPAYASYVKEWL